MTSSKIQQKRQCIEQLLDNMPSGLVEARRYITSETEREPEPQFLQCMVKVAGDGEAEGLRRDIPRSLLSVRAVADEQLALFHGEETSDPAVIQEAAAVLKDLEQALDRIENQLAEALPGMEQPDREYLTGLRDRLAPSREKLLTAQVLSRFYRLESRPEPPAAGGAAGRDGAILLHLIGIDLAAWMESGAAGEGERDQLWKRLNYCRDAYKAVGKQIASRKDKAFMEGGREEYDTLNRLQRQLFAAYSRLSKVLAAGKDGPEIASGENTGGDPDLSSSIAEAEQAAKAIHQANEQRREVMDNALRGVRESRTVAPQPMNYLLREEKERRRRIRILGIVCAVLAVGAVSVNLMLMAPRGTVTELSPEDFINAIPLQQATPAATMMLAETGSGLWNIWSLEDRQEHVLKLTREAESKGFSSLLLSDETGRQLAFWQRGQDPSVF